MAVAAAILVAGLLPGPASGAGQVPENIRCEPSSVDTGSVVLGTGSSERTVTCTNTGRSRETITAIETTGADAGDFVPATEPCLVTLAPGASCDIVVTFTPGGTGPREAVLGVVHAQPQGVTGRVEVPLHGIGIERDTTLTFEPASLTFAERLGLTTSEPQGVIVTNAGSVPVTIDAIDVAGESAADFAISTSSCGGALQPGASCEVSVTFTPRAPGARAADLRFADDGAGAPHLVPLRGTGTTPTLLVTPAVGPAGTVVSGIGAGFPPDQAVTLRWAQPQDGAVGGFPEPDVATTTGGGGSLAATVLLFPKTPLGTRVLLATAGAFGADAELLVVPGTAQAPDFVVRG
jgi:hypothetical protein